MLCAITYLVSNEGYKAIAVHTPQNLRGGELPFHVFSVQRPQCIYIYYFTVEKKLSQGY